VRILATFTNSPEFTEFAQDVGVEVICRDAWPEVQKLLEIADFIVIDCRDLLLYRICAHFLLFPWTRKPLVAVELALRRPVAFGTKIWRPDKALVALLRVGHYIHYFRGISGYTTALWDFATP
jgi:hypothetical protein